MTYASPPEMPYPEDRDTFVSRIGVARSDAIDLAARVTRLADRLCGAVPTGDDNAKLKALPSGLLGEASEGAGEIAEAVKRGNAALDRIERSLPAA